MATRLWGQMGAALLGLALCLMLCSLHGASAQTSGDCSASLMTLEPCFGYIQTGNGTRPGIDCCTPLMSVFQVNATCLCQIATMAPQLGVTLNQTRALEVATLCNQTVPGDVITCLSSPSGPSTTNSTLVPSPPPPSGSTGTTPPSNGDGSYATAIPIPLLVTSFFTAFSLQIIIYS